MNINTIEKIVCDYYNLNYSEINTKTRGKEHIAFARQLIMYLSMSWLRYSTSRAANLFKRDHTTAVHARKKVLDLYDSYFDTRIDINNIERKISGELLVPNIVVRDIDLLSLSKNYTKSRISLNK